MTRARWSTGSRLWSSTFPGSIPISTVAARSMTRSARSSRAGQRVAHPYFHPYNSLERTGRGGRRARRSAGQRTARYAADVGARSTRSSKEPPRSSGSWSPEPSLACTFADPRSSVGWSRRGAIPTHGPTRELWCGVAGGLHGNGGNAGGRRALAGRTSKTVLIFSSRCLVRAGRRPRRAGRGRAYGAAPRRDRPGRW